MTAFLTVPYPANPHKGQERAAEAKTAAGLIPRFYSDQGFEETLRAQWLGETDQ